MEVTEQLCALVDDHEMVAVSPVLSAGLSAETVRVGGASVPVGAFAFCVIPEFVFCVVPDVFVFCVAFGFMAIVLEEPTATVTAFFTDPFGPVQVISNLYGLRTVTGKPSLRRSVLPEPSTHLVVLEEFHEMNDCSPAMTASGDAKSSTIGALVTATVTDSTVVPCGFVHEISSVYGSLGAMDKLPLVVTALPSPLTHVVALLDVHDSTADLPGATSFALVVKVMTGAFSCSEPRTVPSLGASCAMSVNSCVCALPPFCPAF